MTTVSDKSFRDHFAGDLVEMQKQLYYYALQLTDDREYALDLVQETSYKALKNRKRLQNTEHIRAWLYTILKNTYINYLRSSQYKHLAYDSDEVSIFSDSGRENGNPLPDVILQRKELREMIRQLPVNYGRPIKMMLSGYSYKEIAQQMEIPIGTVKSRIHLGKKKIRKTYTA
ncbi:MAG: sigma-70 family RNA polymerase sigma factor [Bacteroidetes bacterium]|nr:sigma-70 family RNA polymerase sigma factor [Bacteroidota bacterium]